MIKVIMDENSVDITGHSRPDICASMSTLTYAIVSCLDKTCSSEFTWSDDGKEMKINLLKGHSKVAEDLFSVLISGITDLYKQYGDCVNVEHRKIKD